MKRKPSSQQLFAALAESLAPKVRPPFGIVLGSPLEAADLAQQLGGADVTCFQMDLFPAARLEDELRQRNLPAKVVAAADLWDLPEPVQTLLYPVPQTGERSLKIDLVEQAFHVLRPGGVLLVLSPFEKDQLFPNLLKKVFGRVHAPMAGHNMALWAQRQSEHPRRRHEVTFQVRVDEQSSLRFVSRPGVFAYGRFDDGARALMEIAQVNPGEHILDLGCGCGTNGILAGRRAGQGGHVVFVDSNLRAVALADLNARAAGLTSFGTLASCTLAEAQHQAFDVVLANPPYFSQMSITSLFIQAAKDCLKPDGRLYLVTKLVEQTAAILAETFQDVTATERRGYVVFAAQ